MKLIRRIEEVGISGAITRSRWECLRSWSKFGVFLACLVSISAVSFGDETEAGAVRPVFIFAGQSNMVGFDAKPALLPKSELDASIWIWWAVGDPPADQHDSTSGGKWKPLQPQPKGKPKLPRNGKTRQYGNFENAEGGFGPEMGFIRTWMRDDIGRNPTPDSTRTRPLPRALILKVAYNGTSVANDWNPDQENEPGNCLGRLFREWDAARIAANGEGIRLEPAGLFWVQGESDSGRNRSKAYATNLKRVLSAIRKRFDAPELPAFLAINTKFGGPNNTGVRAVVESQRSVAAADPLTTYVDTSKATIANGAHYDAAGTLDVGRWFAEAFSILKMPSSTSRSPR